MAGFFKRAMVYLGLVDDEYDEYEPRDGRLDGACTGRRSPKPTNRLRSSPRAASGPCRTSSAGHKPRPSSPALSCARCLQRQVPACT